LFKNYLTKDFLASAIPNGATANSDSTVGSAMKTNVTNEINATVSPNNTKSMRENEDANVSHNTNFTSEPTGDTLNASPKSNTDIESNYLEGKIRNSEKRPNKKKKNKNKNGCKHWKRRTLIERSTTDTFTYNTEDNVIHPNDYVTWNNEVYDESEMELKGSSRGFCMFLPQLIYECSISYEFNIGQLMVQGSFVDNPWTLAVVGGTGCFVGAQGTVEVLANYQGQSNKVLYDINLL